MHRYERIVFWSEEDQKWIVDVPELSGCMADGATPVEALENVETIIDEWIETARARAERPSALCIGEMEMFICSQFRLSH